MSKRALCRRWTFGGLSLAIGLWFGACSSSHQLGAGGNALGNGAADGSGATGGGAGASGGAAGSTATGGSGASGGSGATGGSGASGGSGAVAGSGGTGGSGASGGGGGSDAGDSGDSGDDAASCGSTTCAAGRICCSVPDNSGVCHDQCMTGPGCPKIACKSDGGSGDGSSGRMCGSSTCVAGEQCCAVPSTTGACTPGCVAGPACASAPCNEPDAGTTSCVATGAAAAACGKQCCTKGEQCCEVANGKGICTPECVLGFCPAAPCAAP